MLTNFSLGLIFYLPVMAFFTIITFGVILFIDYLVELFKRLK